MKELPGWLRDHWLLGTTAIVLVVLLLTVSAQVLLWSSIPYRGYGASYVIIELPEGTTATRAIELLEEHGVIERSALAPLYLKVTGRTRVLKAGEYSFTRPMTPGEVFDKMISGDVYYHRVTIPEGVRSDEVFAQFVRSGFGTETQFREAFRDTQPIAELDPEATDLEGYLYPDTYSLRKGTAPKAILATMVARFREVFQPSWVEAVKRHGLTVRGGMSIWTRMSSSQRCSTTACVWACVCSAIRRSSTRSICATSMTGTYARRTCASTRATTPIVTRGCPPVRSATPGRRRCGRPWSRQTAAICTSSR